MSYSAHVNEDEDEEYKPWYKERTTPPPFRLARKITLRHDNAPNFCAVALFPWDEKSLSVLWERSLDIVEKVEEWKQMISNYWDTVAVGSDLNFYVFFTNKKREPLSVKPPEDLKLHSTDKMCVAWGMKFDVFEPLVIFSRGGMIFVYNVIRMGLSGYIRGHGGPITSISVHPTTPHLFCTTSRDFTTRIYDLNLRADYTVDMALDFGKTKRGKAQEVPNPHWPPGKRPSLAGAAHGLRLPPSFAEGTGDGRCVSVLQGGRSAGHEAAVLGSAFHPKLPLIATCGMDRTVKIWPVRPTSELQIKREDKPLFSSGMLHKARVLSITWLQDNILLTHSAPAIMRTYPDSKRDKTTYIEAGELIIWRWLGLDRFFPPEYEKIPLKEAMKGLRGCSSDYQESSSFKIISIHAFPAVPTQYIAPNLSLFQSPIHDPLIIYVYPGESYLCMLNASHMLPRDRPPLPREVEKLLEKQQDDVGSSLADATGHMRLEVPEDEDENEDDDRIHGTILRRPVVIPPGIDYRKIDVDEQDPGRLINCAMGMGGRVVVGVGSKGSVWIWRYDD